MAATTTSCAARARVRAAALVLAAAALAPGCRGTIQSSPDAAALPLPGCGGTIDMAGRSPDGPFTATSVYADIADHPSICAPDLQFIVGDSATGSTFVFHVPVGAPDGGAPVPLGMTSVVVGFAGRPNTGTAQFQAPTTATIDVAAADPPPFATCEHAGGNGIDLKTGTIAMTLTMLQDGFGISGALSTPYCACRVCPDTN